MSGGAIDASKVSNYFEGQLEKKARERGLGHTIRKFLKKSLLRFLSMLDISFINKKSTYIYKNIVLGRPWASRTFKLVGQELAYFDDDDLKGNVSTEGCLAEFPPADLELDGREFCFHLIIPSETLLLSASSDAERRQWMEVLNLSATSATWSQHVVNPPK